MKRLLSIAIIILMGSLAFPTHGQFITFFEAFKPNEIRADRYFELKNYQKAAELYELAVNKDPTSPHLKLKLAKTYVRLQKTREAEKLFAPLLKNPKVFRSEDRLEYIQCLIDNGKKEMAKALLTPFVKDNPKNDAAKLLLSSLNDNQRFYKDSALYKTKRILAEKDHADFSPMFYNDGLVFVSSRNDPWLNIHISQEDSTDFYDLFYVPIRRDSLMGKPKPLDPSLNSYYHQGPVTFFDNGRKMIFTTNKKEGVSNSKNLHLYMAERDSNSTKWKNVRLLPFNSDNYSVAHPAMNPKGDMLYFSSDMPGGSGGADLYQVSYIQGNWGTPSNLGKKINSSKNEFFPFCANDSLLYFSTDGKPGLGGLDVFESNLENGSYTEPTNVGTPINSSKDDFGFIIDPTLSYGYFSSNRAQKNDDIYYFKTDYVIFKLKIVDDLNRKVLENYTVTLEDEQNSETATGKYEKNQWVYKLVPNRKYTLKIQNPIYKPYIRPIWTVNRKETDMSLTAEMVRKVKNFVHASVIDPQGKPTQESDVVLINLDSMRVDSLKRFYFKNEFDFEVDNSMRYVLMAQKGNTIGIEEILPTKTKKASTMVYANLKLKKFYPFQIKGTVKDKESKSLVPGYLVTVRDMVLGYTYQIFTDENGQFEFTGYTYTRYELSTENAENRTVWPDIDYIKAHGQLFDLLLK